MKLRPWVGAPATWVWLAGTIGIYELWRRRNTLEFRGNEIAFSRGIVRRHERVLPIARVQDVTVNRTLWWARVTVSTAGGGPGIVDAGPYSAWRAREFSRTVRGQLHSDTTGV